MLCTGCGNVMRHSKVWRVRQMLAKKQIKERGTRGRRRAMVGWKQCHNLTDTGVTAISHFVIPFTKGPNDLTPLILSRLRR